MENGSKLWTVKSLFSSSIHKTAQKCLSESRFFREVKLCIVCGKVSFSGNFTDLLYSRVYMYHVCGGRISPSFPVTCVWLCLRLRANSRFHLKLTKWKLKLFGLLTLKGSWQWFNQTLPTTIAAQSSDNEWKKDPENTSNSLFNSINHSTSVVLFISTCRWEHPAHTQRIKM